MFKDERTEFQPSLMKALMEHGAHVINIESHATALGVPDLNCGQGGREQWLELKLIRPRGAKVSLAQKRWINKRIEVGGTVWLIAGSQTTDKYYIVPGSRVEEVLGVKGERTWANSATTIVNTLEGVVSWLTS